jgi:carbon monoxide dehydrogenase subunit G
VPDLVERIDVDASPDRVWAALTDWTGHGEWMLATDVVTVEGPAVGVGGRLAARTGLPLPGGRRIGVLDTMVITEWDPPRRAVVQHTGRLVRGPAVLEVLPRGEHATVVWTERVYPPFGLLGQLGWVLARPLGAAWLRRSLRRFRKCAASSSGDPGRPAGGGTA